MASGHHEPHGGAGYAQDSWMNLGNHHHHQHHQYGHTTPQNSISPMNEYQSFDYGQTSLPMEPAYNMPRPPPYASSHHPLPPPLVMPTNGVWPSMLANQNTYQQPILPANHIHTPVSAATSHGSELTPVTPASAKSTSRRKLTDEERRQMCLEAEQNPQMKQTQIGAKFNVERSTVSKILRQKDKYMKPAPKEEVTSPGKKSKVKLPDFEKTLANWVRNQQKKGIPITDEELRKQALMFSAGRNDQHLVSGASWLEKFKLKHLEGKGDANSTPIDTSGDGSPISSNGLVSPPMSSMDAKLDTLDPTFDLDSKDHLFDQQKSIYPDTPADMNPSAEAILSPISPEFGRHDGLAVTLPRDSHTTFNMSVRQRSQTFHQLPEPTIFSTMASAGTPSLLVRSQTSTDLDSCREGSVDPRHTMKRHKSVPNIHDTEVIQYTSMQPPPLPRSADISPISQPGSPAPTDDNIRALYQIKLLFEQRPDVAEPDDYVMIGKLLEKLKLLRSPTSTPALPAGMQAIDIPQSPRISKKRTILGIST